MANLKEIETTLKIAKKNGATDITLLYCVSNYPAKISDFNFHNIRILKERYNCKVGFSDHSTDNRVVAAAIAAGAEVIEKHIALEGQKKGFDLAFSLKGKEIKDYVMFSFELYKNNPYWIPPIITEELETFDKTKNPALQTAEAHFYLAYKNNKIVGKITAIINWEEVNLLNKKKVRFGWFDVIDDIEVTKALLNKVEELGKKHNMDHMEGPMGFSNLDKVGILSEGFDQIGNMITWYSLPYYITHFEQLGFVKEKE